ncbi:uncharacterized protein DUF1045 [Martelella mediterranea]|uniref:Uncharacterized protein DUF1045 n=2 Tax=Martelella mediterranea TaxID=293089 RepID=A0A4R3NV38_9HYPH|nr:uncharacterized protein DUF1045 [Martelella mediterranea]
MTMCAEKKRYVISFTPPPYDALGIVGANWLGRNAFSNVSFEPQFIRGCGLHEIAYHTAVPRRYGFQAMLKSPFVLAEGLSEAMLLNALMRFATRWEPFLLSPLAVTRFRDMLTLSPLVNAPAMDALAASVVSDLDYFRAPMSDAEFERRDTGDLTPTQFANLYRWGEPDVMSAFHFHLTLTGKLPPQDADRIERLVREFFGPVLLEPVEVGSLALFVEEEPGAPFIVHSLHPMGALPARQTA